MALKVKPSQLKHRALNPETDLNFILSTWLKSYRNSEFASNIPNELYFTHHQILVGQILKHEFNAVTIICSPDDEDQIIGYIVYNTKEPVVFYTYVKYQFRKFGIGQWMLEGIRKGFEGRSLTCTHRCKRWAKVAKKHNLVYNPYITGNVSNEIPKEGSK